MALQQLEHFLIQTGDLDASRDWYESVLGLKPGPAPEFHFRVCWLYLGDTAVLHLAEGGENVDPKRIAYLGQQSSAIQGSGVIDHVAFHANDAASMLAHFDTLGLEYVTREISDDGSLQVFLFDPNGVKVELNFKAADASGIQAEISTADLVSSTHG